MTAIYIQQLIKKKMQYKNPLSWNEIGLVIGFKVFFIILHRFISENLSWLLFYVLCFVIIIYGIYELAVFKYNEENINNLSVVAANPYYLLYAFISIPLYYLVIYICGISMEPDTKIFIIAFFELYVWISFFLLIFIDFFHYIFNKQILTLFYIYFIKSNTTAAQTQTNTTNEGFTTTADIAVNNNYQLPKPQYSTILGDKVK